MITAHMRAPSIIAFGIGLRMIPHIGRVLLLDSGVYSSCLATAVRKRRVYIPVLAIFIHDVHQIL